MRLINAETAEKELAELVELYEKRMPNWNPNDMLTSGRDAAFKWGFKADGAEKALEIIKDMPTVDAEPVKHAYWIDLSEEYTDCDENVEIVKRFKCSSCGNKETTKSDYCRRCGAKMDGGTDNGS